MEKFLRIELGLVREHDLWLGRTDVLVDEVSSARHPGFVSVRGRIMKKNGQPQKASHWWSFPEDMIVEVVRKEAF